MRVLVTGATGFVGRALVPALAAAGHEVVAAVRTPSATHVPDGVEVKPVEDLGPETDWSPALKGVEGVVHLAARVHVIKEEVSGPLADSLADPMADPLAAFRRVNTAGTGCLAQAAAAAGVRRLVFLSSVKVNGDSSGAGAFRETDPPRPPDPYALSKWEAEQILNEIALEGRLETVILRPPLVYGPGVKGNFLSLLKLCRWAPILPLGGLANWRSLIYVGNLVDAIMACLVHPAAPGQTFLVRDDEDVSVTDLVRRTGSALGHAPGLIPAPERLLRLAGRLTGNQAVVARLLDSLVVNDGKIRQMLGWAPPFTMTDGLDVTAAWFLSRNQG